MFILSLPDLPLNSFKCFQFLNMLEGDSKFLPRALMKESNHLCNKFRATEHRKTHRDMPVHNTTTILCGGGM